MNWFSLHLSNIEYNLKNKNIQNNILPMLKTDYFESEELWIVRNNIIKCCEARKTVIFEKNPLTVFTQTNWENDYRYENLSNRWVSSQFWNCMHIMSFPQQELDVYKDLIKQLPSCAEFELMKQDKKNKLMMQLDDGDHDDDKKNNEEEDENNDEEEEEEVDNNNNKSKNKLDIDLEDFFNNIEDLKKMFIHREPPCQLNGILNVVLRPKRPPYHEAMNLINNYVHIYDKYIGQVNIFIQNKPTTVITKPLNIKKPWFLFPFQDFLHDAILTHSFAPSQVKILNEKEEKEFLAKTKLTKNQLHISKSSKPNSNLKQQGGDAYVRYLGIPVGSIIEVHRKSDTTPCYRTVH
jgi:DNA-directed RNA polymerase subunit H (RpoH/RPB5)